MTAYIDNLLFNVKNIKMLPNSIIYLIGLLLWKWQHASKCNKSYIQVNINIFKQTYTYSTKQQILQETLAERWHIVAEQIEAATSTNLTYTTDPALPHHLFSGNEGKQNTGLQSPLMFRWKEFVS